MSCSFTIYDWGNCAPWLGFIVVTGGLGITKQILLKLSIFAPIETPPISDELYDQGYRNIWPIYYYITGLIDGGWSTVELFIGPFLNIMMAVLIMTYASTNGQWYIGYVQIAANVLYIITLTLTVVNMSMLT